MLKRIFLFITITYITLLLLGQIKADIPPLTGVNAIIEVTGHNNNISEEIAHKFLTGLNGSGVIGVKKNNNKYIIEYILPEDPEKASKIKFNIQKQIELLENSKPYYQCVQKGDNITRELLEKYITTGEYNKDLLKPYTNKIIVKINEDEKKELFGDQDLVIGEKYLSNKPYTINRYDFFMNKYNVNRYFYGKLSDIKKSTGIEKKKGTKVYYALIKYKKKGDGVIIEGYNNDKLDIIKGIIDRYSNDKNNGIQDLISYNEDYTLTMNEQVLGFFKNEKELLSKAKINEKEILFNKNGIILVDKDDMYMLILDSRYNLLDSNELNNLLSDRYQYIFNKGDITYLDYKIQILNNEDNNYLPNQCDFIKKKIRNVFIK